MTVGNPPERRICCSSSGDISKALKIVKYKEDDFHLEASNTISNQYINESISNVTECHEIYIRDIRTWNAETWEALRIETQHYQELYCLGDCFLRREKADLLANYVKSLEGIRCLLLPVEVARHRNVLLRILPRSVKYLILTCQAESQPYDAIQDIFSEFDNLDDLPPYVLCQDYIRRSIPGLLVPYHGGFHSVQEVFALFHSSMPSPLMENVGNFPYINDVQIPDMSQGYTQLHPYGVLLRFGLRAIRPTSLPKRAINIPMHPLWQKFFTSNLSHCVPWSPLRYLNDTWVWVTQNAPEPEIRYPASDLLKYDLGDVYRKGRLVARIGCYGIVKTESIYCEHVTRLESLLFGRLKLSDHEKKHRGHHHCGIPLHYEVMHLSEIQPSIRSILHEDLKGVRSNPLMQDETILFPATPLLPGLMILGLIRDVLADRNRLIVSLPSVAGEFEIDVDGCERYVCLARHPGSDHHPPFYLGCPKLSTREKRKGTSLTPKTRATTFDFSWMCSEAFRKQDPDVVCLSQYQQLCVAVSTNPTIGYQRPEPPPLDSASHSSSSAPLRKSSRLSAQRAQANIAMLTSQEGVDHTDLTPDRNVSNAFHSSPEFVVNGKSQIFRAQHIGRPQPPCPEKPQLPTNTSLLTQAPQLKCMSSVGDTPASLRGSKRPALVTTPSCPIPLDACPATSVPCDSSSASDCYPRPQTKRRKRERRDDDTSTNSHIPPPQSVSTLTTVASQSHPVHDPASSGGGLQTSDEDGAAIQSQTSTGARGDSIMDEDELYPPTKTQTSSSYRIPLSTIHEKQQRSSLREKLVSALSLLASLGLDVVGSSSSGLYHTFAEPVPIHSPRACHSSVPTRSHWAVPPGSTPRPAGNEAATSNRDCVVGTQSILNDGSAPYCGHHDLPLSESPPLATNMLAASNFNSSPAVGSRTEETLEAKYLRHYSALYRKYPPQLNLFCKDRQGRRQMTFDHLFSTRGSHQSSGIRTRRQTRDKSLTGCSNLSPSVIDLDKKDVTLGPVGTMETLEALLSEQSDCAATCSTASSSVLCLSGSAVNRLVDFYVNERDGPSRQPRGPRSRDLVQADSESISQLTTLIKTGQSDGGTEIAAATPLSRKTKQSESSDTELFRAIPAMQGLCPCAHLVPISVTQESTGVNKVLLNFDCWRNPSSYSRDVDTKRCSHETMSSSAENSSACRMPPSNSAARRRTPRLSPSHCRSNRREQSATDTSSGSGQTDPVGLPSRSILSSTSAGATVTLDPRNTVSAGSTGPDGERQRSEGNQLSKQEVAQLRQRLKILFERLCVTEPKLLEVTHAVASACAHLAVSRRLSTTEFLAIVSVPKLVADRSGEICGNVCIPNIPVLQVPGQAPSMGSDIDMHMTDNLEDLPSVNWQRSMDLQNTGSMVRYYSQEAGPRILTSTRSMPGPMRNAQSQQHGAVKLLYSQQQQQQPSRPLWTSETVAATFDLGQHMDSRRSRLSQAERLHPTVSVAGRPPFAAHQRDLSSASIPNGIAAPSNRDLTRDMVLHGSDGVPLELRQKAFWKYGAKPVGSPNQVTSNSQTNFQVMRTGVPIAAFAKAPPYQCRPPMQQSLSTFKPPSRQHETQLSAQSNVS